MSEPKMFTEEEIRQIIKEEVMTHLKVSGWAGLESNGCGYNHVTGGASARWDDEKLVKKNERGT